VGAENFEIDKLLLIAKTMAGRNKGKQSRKRRINQYKNTPAMPMDEDDTLGIP